MRSKAELLFVKLLLSRTPSLLRMCISQWTDIDIETALELICFPRASPRAERYSILNTGDNPRNDITLGYNPSRSPLEKLLVSLTALEVLHLDSFFVELLSAHVVPDGLPFTLNCLWCQLLNVDFGKMGRISCAVQLIRNSPNLSELKILVYSSRNNAEAVLKYLDTPSCLERPLGKLEYVAINDFKRSKAELLFVKLLLTPTP